MLSIAGGQHVEGHAIQHLVGVEAGEVLHLSGNDHKTY